MNTQQQLLDQTHLAFEQRMAPQPPGWGGVKATLGGLLKALLIAIVATVLVPLLAVSVLAMAADFLTLSEAICFFCYRMDVYAGVLLGVNLVVVLLGFTPATQTR